MDEWKCDSIIQNSSLFSISRPNYHNDDVGRRKVIKLSTDGTHSQSYTDSSDWGLLEANVNNHTASWLGEYFSQSRGEHFDGLSTYGLIQIMICCKLQNLPFVKSWRNWELKFRISHHSTSNAPLTVPTSPSLVYTRKQCHRFGGWK